MDALTVRRLVEQELATLDGQVSVNGLDLQRCLVHPTLQTFKGYPKDSPDWELWVVMEEDPADCSGYKVAYDPEDGAFCLAYGRQPGAQYIGHYGGFLDALRSM
jgi:hypothetical protein